jgi:hypothetical protein
VTLLTVDDLRQWPEFAETDEDVLQLLLDAEEQAIEREMGGPVGAVTEVVDGGYLTFITLRWRAAGITSVETTHDEVLTTLATDDYQLRHDRRSLFRLGTGTNPGYRWPNIVTIEYDVEDDEAIRKRVQKELIALDMNYAPGSTSEQIGSWMEQQQKSSVWNAAAERNAIMATLWPGFEFDFA